MALRSNSRLFEWGSRHKPQIAFVGATSIMRYGTGIAYATIPIMVAFSHGEWLSGLFLGGLNFFQALVTDPIAGGLSDRIGSKSVVIFGGLLTATAGIVWLVFPLSNIFFLLLFGILMFAGYSFRDEVNAYLLRTSAKSEGGLIFGFAENIFAVTTFLATISIPYFVVTSHHTFAALIMIGCALASLIILWGLPNDVSEKKKEISSLFNPFYAIRRGWHFVKTNDYYPMLTLGSSVFEGIFYGTLWFVIPLKIGEGDHSLLAGLSLGIYEIVTTFAASYSGYLADKYRWSTVNIAGWIIAAAGALALLASANALWLVVIGAIIALGNNFFFFASSHALEEHDIDHREDGSFIGLNNLVVDLGYGISPLVSGVFYYFFGFSASLIFAAAVTVALAFSMIALTRRKVRQAAA